MTFQSWAAMSFVTIGVLLAIVRRHDLLEWARECFHDEDGHEYSADLAEFARAAKDAELHDLYGDRDDIYGWHDNDNEVA